MDQFSLGLSLFEGIGPKKYLGLIKKFGSAENAWEKLDSSNSKDTGISENLFQKFNLFRFEFKLDDYLQKLKKTKATFVSYTDQRYPNSLKDLDAPPIGIFCKGNLELLSSKNNIGVVGARKITSYGRDVTQHITSELSRNYMVITSGLALGVDASAHQTAIDLKGGTIAVLGCGVDCVSPTENQDLYEKILDNNGLIISEYPLGMPPSKGSFPARNRIIAALSLGVLITEAAEDSGSLITAEEALKLGRKVFAVPGPITSQMSRGSLKLLKQGAKLVSSADDILDELSMKDQKSNVKNTEQILKTLNAQEKKVVSLLETESLSLDSLSKIAKIPIHTLLGVVTKLELQGILKNVRGEIGIVQ